MQLDVGSRVGPYEILARAGGGGMGDVWKARDSRLDRTVAIKVAKAAFGERFLREARAVAALNHPHVCQLYDVGPDYLVMEYVDGAVLKCPLPLGKVAEYAFQILDALDAAHRKHIIHRDLKPGNIMVTKSGVKLVDFGLAKQAGPLEETDVTRTEVLTGQGQILGTLPYMAPEQLQGQEADARSDLFAFGCVLYEMLSGRRAFTGDSPASVIAAVLERQPEPISVPAPLDRVVRTCLEKDPHRRFQTAVDLKRALQWAVEPAPEVAPLSTGRRFRQARIWLAAGAGIAALVFAAWWLRPGAGAAGGLRFAKNVRLTFDGQSITPALSPDGKFVVYSSSRTGNLELYAQQLKGGGTVRLTEHAATDIFPQFSADSTKVYFNSEREPKGVYEVPALGGDARLAIPDALWPTPSPDGRWLAFVRGTGLFVWDVDGGGPPRAIAEFVSERPQWSPDSSRILIRTRSVRVTPEYQAIAFDGAAKSSVPLIQNLRRRGMFDAFRTGVIGWSRGGDLLFTAPFGDAINVWRVPLDQAGTAAPEVVTLGTSTEDVFADARGGKLVYTTGGSVTSLWTLPADLDNAKVAGALRRLTFDRTSAFHQDVSPNGRFVAYCSRKGGAQGIWLLDLQTGKDRLVLQSVAQRDAYAHLQFSPDGAQLAANFVAYQGEERARPAQLGIVDLATGEWKKLVDEFGRIRGWSRDGRLLIVWRQLEPSHVAVLDVKTGTWTAILSREGAAVAEPRLSADGRWVCFRADGTLHIAPFRGSQPVPAQEWKEVASNGTLPFWSPNGRNLYYVVSTGRLGAFRGGSGILMRQPFDPAAGRLAGPPQRFYSFEHERLGGPVVNQMTGGPAGVVTGLVASASDVWALDLPE